MHNTANDCLKLFILLVK